MTNYRCEKCNKIFSQKCHLITHLNKKNPCTNNYNNFIVVENTKDTNSIINNIVSKNKLIQNINQVKNVKKMQINNKNIKNITRTYNCEYCNSEFTQSGSLNRHMLKRCKEYKKDTSENNLQTIIKTQAKEINKLKNLQSKHQIEIEKIKNLFYKYDAENKQLKNFIKESLQKDKNNSDDNVDYMNNNNENYSNQIVKVYKKRRIPIALKNTLWILHFKDKINGICQYCKVEPIHITNFDAGHIESEKMEVPIL